ncbi:MAG: hypothetical protein AAFV53_26795 [Myxococcota bacterium]
MDTILRVRIDDGLRGNAGGLSDPFGRAQIAFVEGAIGSESKT